MTHQKRSDAISILTGIIVIGIVSICSYFLGRYHSANQFTLLPFISFSQKNRAMPTLTPPVSLQTCQSDILGISLTVPKWTACSSKKFSETDAAILINSSFFNIVISNESRNEPCISNPSIYGYDPNCTTALFYSTPSLSTTLYSYQGKNTEIYGNFLDANNKPGTPIPWISIKYQNMGNQPMTEEQKNELIELLDLLFPL